MNESASTHSDTMTVYTHGGEWNRDWPCTGNVHYFDKVPGRCRCERETWKTEPPRLRLVE